MQGWRKSMEDAHITSLDLGDKTDTAMFGVFDGHGGSEVARFCQKYMAAEITKLQHYHEGRLSDSLVEVFHKMDIMLADGRYSQELDQLRRKPPKETGQEEPEAGVSPTDAMDIIRRVLQMRQQPQSDAAGAVDNGIQQIVPLPAQNATEAGHSITPALPPVPPAQDPTHVHRPHCPAYHHAACVHATCKPSMSAPQQLMRPACGLAQQSGVSVRRSHAALEHISGQCESVAA